MWGGMIDWCASTLEKDTLEGDSPVACWLVVQVLCVDESSCLGMQLKWVVNSIQG